MSDVHVTRHGERWAVAEEPGAPPVSEHPTRAAAESAARALARERGGEVRVSEEDPSGLRGHEDPAAGEQTGPPPGSGTAGDSAEHLRETQAGL